MNAAGDNFHDMLPAEDNRMSDEPEILLRQYVVRQGEDSIEVVPLFTPAPNTLPLEIVELATKAGLVAAERKRIAATCKHDEGVIMHKGEEVCTRCSVCPIPR
jgi:hypothetical protein